MGYADIGSGVGVWTWRSVFLFLLCACGGGSSSSDTYEVIGTVRVTEDLIAQSCRVLIEGTPLGARCDSDGLFRVAGLPGGTWTAQIHPPDDLIRLVPASRDPFAAQTGDVVDTGVHVLATPGAISGRAAPVEQVAEPGSIVLVPGTGAITATRDGVFLLDAVPPGVRTALLVTTEGSVRRDGIEIAPSALTANVNFDLAGRIAGASEVVGEVVIVGRSQAAVTVELVNRVNGQLMGISDLANGRFMLPAQAGGFLVRATLAGNPYPALIDVVVEANQRVDIGRMYLFADTDDGQTFFEDGDADGDGVPDVMDPSNETYVQTAIEDGDSDTFYNHEDNCPTVANADQVDTDQDGVGDACTGFGIVASGHINLRQDCAIKNLSQSLEIRPLEDCTGGDILFFRFSNISPFMATPSANIWLPIEEAFQTPIRVRLHDVVDNNLELPSTFMQAEAVHNDFIYEYQTDIPNFAIFPVHILMSQGLQDLMDQYSAQWSSATDIIISIQINGDTPGTHVEFGAEPTIEVTGN